MSRVNKPDIWYIVPPYRHGTRFSMMPHPPLPAIRCINHIQSWRPQSQISILYSWSHRNIFHTNRMAVWRPTFLFVLQRNIYSALSAILCSGDLGEGEYPAPSKWGGVRYEYLFWYSCLLVIKSNLYISEQDVSFLLKNSILTVSSNKIVES